MDKIKLNLENCYGIKKLQAELEFKSTGYAIYAPNGVMKTSFAKTMMDISKGHQPKDLAFPTRTTVCDITWNDIPIKEDEIFVVKSYDDQYSSDAVSTLLANESLKKKYEEVHKDIGEAKKNLDKKLRSVAGYGEKAKENLDPILERIFSGQYYDALLGIKSEIDSLQEEDFCNTDYTIVFNQKVTEFLKEDSSQQNIKYFAQKYHELTNNSPILRENFQYHHVNQVHQQLKVTNFFNAGHSINLCDKNGQNKQEFTTDASLLEEIENEKLRVLSDPALQKKFDAFNNKLKNKELQNFRDYITQNQHILPELEDLKTFERKLWLQYIYKAKSEYDLLIQKYENGQIELNKIILEAEKYRNDWDDVIDDFNQRFLHLPFQLSVQNKSDVILKEKTSPSIVFDFIDGSDNRSYSDTQRNELLNILSTGEARALYILNIMFEVHTRWKVRKKTLFIFDDISDSFDYKNKFAIIDYLDHIIKSEDTNFITIILTHNFDFLRTIESREICQTSQCLMAFKDNQEIILNDFKRSDIRNPFEKWQSRLNEANIQIAYIPFLRNVIEYTKGKKDVNGASDIDYDLLTKMLHYKNDTESLTINQYKEIFEKYFSNLKFPSIDLTQNMLKYIMQTADNCLVQSEGINLEHKIVLSIAIRMLAEKFMIEKIRNVDQNYDTTRKQMGNLLQDYKNKFNNSTDTIKLLKRVNLITPANIHLNAFMYEPILDMGFGELKNLYQDVKDKLV
jgi:hypothetical protein